MIEIDNKELVDDFKDYLRIDKNYSENTIESYITSVAQFNKNFDSITMNKSKTYCFLLNEKPFFFAPLNAVHFVYYIRSRNDKTKFGYRYNLPSVQ